MIKDKKGENKNNNNNDETTIGNIRDTAINWKSELSSAADRQLQNSKLLFENQIPCEWLATGEAADYLRMSPNALRICVHRGQIRVYRFGRRLRFRVKDLRELLSLKGA